MAKASPALEKPDRPDEASAASDEAWALQDVSLRPTSLAEFIGQEDAKKSLRLAIGAAKQRGEMPDHILFSGPPGLGKTTLAAIIAAELQTYFRQTSAPAVGRPGDMAAILTAVESGMVLFLDEIHRLSAPTSELLYTAMEDFAMDLMVGDGERGRAVRIDLPRFTLVGATTRSGALPGPLLDRFGISIRLDYYTTDELLQILERDVGLLGIVCDRQALALLACRARGTPRIAKKLLRRARDWAQMEAGGRLDIRGVEACLAHIGIDALGLDAQDRRYLAYLAVRMRGRPVGIGTIAAALAEDPVTIESVVEPYLLKIGFLQRTPRGRVVTPDAIEHLKPTLGKVA